MPFKKGDPHIGRAKGTPNKKTIWLLESLSEHGFDYETVLVKLMGQAVKGDKHALEMAHLLVKMVPYIANAPKQDVGINQIETLVINRFEAPASPAQITPSIEVDLVSPTDGQSDNIA